MKIVIMLIMMMMMMMMMLQIRLKKYHGTSIGIPADGFYTSNRGDSDDQKLMDKS